MLKRLISWLLPPQHIALRAIVASRHQRNARNHNGAYVAVARIIR